MTDLDRARSLIISDADITGGHMFNHGVVESRRHYPAIALATLDPECE
jgi:hypothetical protein